MSLRHRFTRPSVLVVDDDKLGFLDAIDDALTRSGWSVEAVNSPREAVRRVQEKLFDVVILDVKFPFKGAENGGLLIAETIEKRVGINAILAISQYEVRPELFQTNVEYSYLPKPDLGDHLGSWATTKLDKKVKSLMRQQYVFVAMPFQTPTYNAWYFDRIKPWIEELGFSVKRMDEITSTGPINTDTFKKIDEAHFFVFFAAEKNPNAFMEAGYALALNKTIVMITDKPKELPFNVLSNRHVTLDENDTSRTRLEIEKLIWGLRT